MGKARRVVRYSAGSLAVVLLAVCAYSAGVVFQARDHTRRVIIPGLEQDRPPLKAGDLTPRQLEILLKVEDPAFFDHGGVDLRTPGAGLTTITQALVKKLFFKRFRPGPAKLKQTLIAYFALDPLVSKEDQLTLFLNRVGLGHGVEGFAQAALHYYGRPFARLSEDEYISLVAMIIAPGNFNLADYPQRNALRVSRIKKLVAGEYRPKGLCDLYYGPLDALTRQGLAPLSYFKSYYRD